MFFFFRLKIINFIVYLNIENLSLLYYCIHKMSYVAEKFI